MANFQCRVGALKSSLQLPQQLFELNSRSISDYFRIGSTTPGGEPQVNIHPDYSDFWAFAKNSTSSNTTSFELHDTLKRLLNNPPSATRVNKIGLLFADSWADYPGVLGIMFDGAFDPNSVFGRVPREGCAVFRNAIARNLENYSGNQLQAEAIQMAYTAIHELGHVFNLYHDESEPNFLASSPIGNVRGCCYHQFTGWHQHFLKNVNHPSVHPGGSPFQDYGNLVDVPGGGLYNLPRTRSNLRLGIRASHDSFWHFEPVELELELGLSGDNKSRRIPNEVDPGYERFQIWITDPTGERRRYRSPNRYCADGSKFTVKKGSPFKRDISIFGQSGGYTFGRAGIHKIECIFQVSKKELIAAKPIEVEIKPIPRKKRSYDRLETILSHGDVGRLLYYREGPMKSKVLSEIESEVASNRTIPCKPELQYSVGKALLKHAGFASLAEWKDARSWATKKEPAAYGRAYASLSKAANNKNATVYCKSKIQRLL